MTMTDGPPTWPTRCDCHPGAAKDGWHEQRCRACRTVELEQWAYADRVGRQMITKMLAARRDDRG